MRSIEPGIYLGDRARSVMDSGLALRAPRNDAIAPRGMTIERSNEADRESE